MTAPVASGSTRQRRDDLGIVSPLRSVESVLRGEVALESADAERPLMAEYLTGLIE